MHLFIYYWKKRTFSVFIKIYFTVLPKIIYQLNKHQCFMGSFSLLHSLHSKDQSVSVEAQVTVNTWVLENKKLFHVAFFNTGAEITNEPDFHEYLLQTVFSRQPWDPKCRFPTSHLSHLPTEFSCWPITNL